MYIPVSYHACSWRKAAEDAEAAAAEALERVERTERQGAERGRALDARLRDVRAREAAVASKCASVCRLRFQNMQRSACYGSMMTSCALQIMLTSTPDGTHLHNLAMPLHLTPRALVAYLTQGALPADLSGHIDD